MAARRPPDADPPQELAALVRAAQEGSPVARSALVERFHPRVLRYCLVAARRDRERALDLCQETFARAFEHLSALEDAARFDHWLLAIAANVCRRRGGQEERRRATLARLALEPVEEALAEEPRGQDELALVRQLVDALPDPRLREVVRLKYGEPEHTTRQIAERLGMPHGTVTVKLMRFRAAARRELLRLVLGDDAPSEES